MDLEPIDEDELLIVENYDDEGDTLVIDATENEGDSEAFLEGAALVLGNERINADTEALVVTKAFSSLAPASSLTHTRTQLPHQLGAHEHPSKPELSLATRGTDFEDSSTHIMYQLKFFYVQVILSVIGVPGMLLSWLRRHKLPVEVAKQVFIQRDLSIFG
ncbi:hypothetical protein EDB85DRAFT_1893697 [Lactarius pseudohatsudake]|nr:hypothetical protein EDB85DRAFT_1893697 [Lactarius pseudohatsudake]